MKKIKFPIYILLGLLTCFASCEEDSTGGVSKVTKLPDFQLTGGDVLLVEPGTPFEDPGATALEGQTELPITSEESGGRFFGATSLDTSSPDLYTISYSATNSDGFPGSVERTVFVATQGDLVNSIEGVYTSTVKRDSDPLSAQYEDMEYVIIKKTGPNTYELSDGIGGYYDLGRGYGVDYAAQPAVVTANDIAANDFDFGSAFSVGLFGGSAEITSMAVDPVAKTINFTSKWVADAETTYTFQVTLTQVEF